MIKKTFVCIFTSLDNAHLTKDIGQIGNALSEFWNINPTLVCYGNKDYPSLKTEAKNQSIHRIKNRGRFLFFEKAVLTYLIREAKNINFLHIQQFNKADIYQVLLYKFLNPKGKILLKQDIHISALEKGIVYSKKKIFNAVHLFFEKIAFQKIDLIALDSEELLVTYQKKYPYIKTKFVVFSQNLNDLFLKENFPHRKSFKEKENIILTTGRIGATDKNYEMLLKTLPLLDLQDWKVIFVGEIHNNFDKKVEQLLTDYPQLRGKVELTGQINDRLNLYEYYNRAKLFCLTSELESFGVSFIEALYFGHFILGTTGMSSFDYISNKEEFGRKLPINDTVKLAQCLNGIIKNQAIITNIADNAHQHIANHFFLSKNIQVLKRLMDE